MIKKDDSIELKTQKSKIKYKFNYFNVRNNAWEFLIKNDVKSYPLNLNEIIKKNNWLICSYADYCAFKQIDQVDLVKELPDGFTILDKNGNYLICFNQNNNKHRNRFTICHEIGHIVLHHIYRGEKLEKEANMFSARILMPMLLIKELEIKSPDKLVTLCDVSIESATFRLKRFNLIKNRMKFYTNRREVDLLKQLTPFIQKERNVLHD